MSRENMLDVRPLCADSTFPLCPGLGEVPNRLSVSLTTLGLAFTSSTWSTVEPESILLNNHNCGSVTKIV